MPGWGLFNGFIIIGFFTVLVSCKTKTIVVENVQNATRPEELADVADAWEKDIHTLKIRQVEGVLILNGSVQNVKGSMALQKDSLIVLSVVPALGYEVLRIVCTPDSIIVINRQEKSYTCSSFESYRARHRIPLGFSEIQAMIAGEVFFYKYYLPGRSYKRYMEDSVTGKLFTLESFDGEKKFTKQIMSLGSAGLESILIEDYEDGRRVNLGYEDYEYRDLFPFPGRVSLLFTGKGNSIEIQLKYGQVIFNEPLRVKFNAPSNYLRVEI